MIIKLTEKKWSEIEYAIHILIERVDLTFGDEAPEDESKAMNLLNAWTSKVDEEKRKEAAARARCLKRLNISIDPASKKK